MSNDQKKEKILELEKNLDREQQEMVEAFIAGMKAGQAMQKAGQAGG